MRVRVAVPDSATSPEVLDAMLEAVTRTNQRLIRAGQVPTAEEAIAAGVKWKPEPPGDEHFDHAAKVISRGWGDCDDLAPYHAGSLRETGEDPNARATVVKTGPKRWHAIVERSDGSYEDPSAAAGMYEYRAPFQPRLVGPEARINIATKQVSGVWVARCDVPWRHSRNAISGHGIGRERGVAVAGALEGAYVIGDSAGIVEHEHLGTLAMIHGLLCGDEEVTVSGAQLLGRAQRDAARHMVKRIGPTTSRAKRAMAQKRTYCAVRCQDWRDTPQVRVHGAIEEAFYGE